MKLVRWTLWLWFVPWLIQTWGIRSSFLLFWTGNTFRGPICSAKSKLSIFHHSVWRFQNETDVLRKVNLRRQIFLKKCQMFLLHILNYKRCLKQFIRLVANIYQYNNSTSLFHTIVLFVCPIKTKMFMFNFPSLIFK